MVPFQAAAERKELQQNERGLKEATSHTMLLLLAAALLASVAMSAAQDVQVLAIHVLIPCLGVTAHLRLQHAANGQ